VRRSPRHLLVIGAQRCGTTYLAALLEAHRDITMARPARPEPKVFLSADLTARGPDWYRSTYFGHARHESLLGEKSTSYLEDPAAPDRARSMLGRDVEVVALLRDPVERAVSNWRFSSDHGRETRPLAVALEENLVAARPWDPAGSSVSPFAYLERGRYAEQLAPWRAVFPERLHVLFTAELIGSERVRRGLYAGLGVDPDGGATVDPGVVNESGTTAPPLAADLQERLRAYFAAGDAALREMLGRDLPWPHHDRREPGDG
jgi:hypothetical protein